MIDQTDDRLGLPPEQEDSDPRLSLSRTGGRASRAADSREAEDAEMTDDQRFEMFRTSLISSVLPDLPKLSGYHCIWLSSKTSNSQDSIHSRERMGYTPLRPDEAPGLTSLAQNSGELAGLISINEMVAYKVPQRLYERMMRYLHHERPREEEEAIRAAAEKFQQDAEAAGSRIQIGDGTTELMNRRDRDAIISG